MTGDFNVSLEHKPPCTGSAVIGGNNAAGAPDLERLQGLLRQFDLRALNTFHPQSGKHTFTMYDSRSSQIDYVFVRARSADSLAKTPLVLHHTELAQCFLGLPKGIFQNLKGAGGWASLLGENVLLDFSLACDVFDLMISPLYGYAHGSLDNMLHCSFATRAWR